MQDVETRLRKAAKDLLTAGKVEMVLGFTGGSLPLRTRPCFVREAGEVDRLVWNGLCANNLAVYLPRLFEKPPGFRGEWTPPKVAVVAKACDARSILGLVKERQVPRANVVIIGMPCRGMVDPQKAQAAAGAPLSDCRAAADGNFEVTTTTGQAKSLGHDDVIAAACLQCAFPSAPNLDVQIEGPSRPAAPQRFGDVKDFEALAPKERWQRFITEISKCIRCYACRQACPNCYCKTCFIDQSKPNWAGAGDDVSDLMLFHIGRIFHQGGRCVECDACVRACPMGIDLRLFTQKVVQDAQELFGYVPGASPDELPPLCTFGADDTDGFITDPQKD